MSKIGYISLKDLGNIASGLNIEGCRPVKNLPKNCKWYNIIQVIDEPLKGETFEKVMEKVKSKNHAIIEEAVGINGKQLVLQLSNLILEINKHHENLLVHVHQYTGTTILDRLLEEATGVKCILDTTNFFDIPVSYENEYPHIDGLVSISQCAGFGYLPGTWIIPEYFMQFDIKEGIIFTEPEYATNHVRYEIVKECLSSFKHVKGPILVVNDLWNPVIHVGDEPKNSVTSEQGYLMLDKEASYVFDFVKKNTTMFDDSHNWMHALCVAKNSTRILNTRDTLYLALLHDVCDHKYSNTLPREKLSSWIHENISRNISCDIDAMIDMVSFSKQTSMEKVHPVLEAVRDGDRMEAIGEIGLERCKMFSSLIGNKVPENVVKHSYEKLLRLVPEGYIVNRNEEIIRRHNVIVSYVNLHKKSHEQHVLYLLL